MDSTRKKGKAAGDFMLNGLDRGMRALDGLLLGSTSIRSSSEKTPIFSRAISTLIPASEILSKLMERQPTWDGTNGIVISSRYGIMELVLELSLFRASKF